MKIEYIVFKIFDKTFSLKFPAKKFNKHFIICIQDKLDPTNSEYDNANVESKRF